MSVARVVYVSGVPEEVRGEGNWPDAQKIAEFIQAQDGLEHSYLLRNREKGEGLSVTVWRDEAALEAAMKRMDDDDAVQAARARIESQGAKVTPAELVYEFLQR
jgi:heme-degrading monooxygenase HmoA